MGSIDRRFVLKGLGAAAVVAAGGRSLIGPALAAAGKISPQSTDVFLVVDVQNCFVPGGSLAVKNGDEVVPLINNIAKRFRHVVLTQDWHTSGHISFASSHGGIKPF